MSDKAIEECRGSRGVVLLSSNYAWTVLNFRMPLIKRLLEEGYRVEVCTQFDGSESDFVNIVDAVHPLFISRRGINPFTDIVSFLNYVKVLRKRRPDVALFFTIKPNIYGSIAAKFTGTACIQTVTGLGTAFIHGPTLKCLASFLYFLSAHCCRFTVFQNIADMSYFLRARLVDKNRTILCPGSGIDVRQFKPLSGVKGSCGARFLYVGRMIADKGIYELVEAIQQVRLKYPCAKVTLVGGEAENRTAIPECQLAEWNNNDAIEYVGPQSDIRLWMSNADCVVLPSYREGLSRVLLEAGAMGIPAITTNVPGCVDVIEHGVNGLICEPRDSESLQRAMLDFLDTSEADRAQMAVNARAKCEQKFSTTVVNDIYAAAIDEVIQGQGKVHA